MSQKRPTTSKDRAQEEEEEYDDLDQFLLDTVGDALDMQPLPMRSVPGVASSSPPSSASPAPTENATTMDVKSLPTGKVIQPLRSNSPSSGGASGNGAERGEQGSSSASPQQPARINAEQEGRALRNEQDVLGAILAAVEDGQSSVSGDIAGLALAHAKNTASASPQIDDKVLFVIEHAQAVASSLVAGAARNKKAGVVLHTHEHVALKRTLEAVKTLGNPVCVALTPCTPEASMSGRQADRRTHHTSDDTQRREYSTGSSVYAAVGTILGAILLLDRNWSTKSVCGTLQDAEQWGAVRALSISAGAKTVAAGYEKGFFILWSAATAAPMKILNGDFSSPIVKIVHAMPSAHQVLVLESSGVCRHVRISRLIGKNIGRLTLLKNAPELPDAITTDIDVLPMPTTAYFRNEHKMVTDRSNCSVPLLFSVSDNDVFGGDASSLVDASSKTGGATVTMPLTVSGHFLVSTVSSDGVVLYSVQSELQTSTRVVATQPFPTTHSFTSALTRFLAVERESPQVLLCCVLNAEMLLFTVRVDARGYADGLVPRHKSTLAASPAKALVTLAGGNILSFHHSNEAVLYDTSLGLVSERHKLWLSEFDTAPYSTPEGLFYFGGYASNYRDGFLLGPSRTTCTFSLLSWNERLDVLLARSRFPEAMELAQHFSEEVALSTVGMSGSASTRRRELSCYMERIVHLYVRYVLDSEAQITQEKPFAVAVYEAVSAVIAFCSRQGLSNVLFGTVLTTLKENNMLPPFFLALESAILEGLIDVIPEHVVYPFFFFFRDEKQLAAAEEGLRGAHLLTAQSTSTALGRRHSLTPSRNTGSLTVDSAGTPATGGVGGGGGAGNGSRRVERVLLRLECDADFLFALADKYELATLKTAILSSRQHKYAEALQYSIDRDKQMLSAAHDIREEATDDAQTSPPHESIAIQYLDQALIGRSRLLDPSESLERVLDLKRVLWGMILDKTSHAVFDDLVALDGKAFLRVLLVALRETGPSSLFARNPSLHKQQRQQQQQKQQQRDVSTPQTQTRPLASSAISALLSLLLGTHPSGAEMLLLLPSDASPRDAALCNTLSKAREVFKPWEIIQRTSNHHYELINLFLLGVESLLMSAAGDVDASDGFAQLDVPLVQLIFVIHSIYLFQVSTSVEKRRDIQLALLEGVNKCGLGAIGGREEGALQLLLAFQDAFKDKRMYRCLADISRLQGSYVQWIDCFLSPEARETEPHMCQDVFDALDAEMNALLAQQEVASLRDRSDAHGEAVTSAGRPSLSASRGRTATQELRRAVLQRISRLVEVDATRLAQFVFERLPSDHRDVIRALQGCGPIFVKYLDELMAKGDESVLRDVHLQGSYIELLCAHYPERVYAYVKNGSNITYDVQAALRTAQRYGVAEAVIFLMEKSSMSAAALTTLTAELKKRLGVLRSEVVDAYNSRKLRDDVSETETPTPARQHPPSLPSSPQALSSSAVLDHPESGTKGPQGKPTYTPSEWKASEGVERLVQIGIEFCQKQSSRKTPARNENWFALLQCVMAPRQLLLDALVEEHHTGGAAETDRMTSSATRDSDTAPPPPPLSEVTFNELDLANNGSEPLSVLSGALSSGGAPLRRFMEIMVAVYSHFTSEILSAAIVSVDLTVLVMRLVESNGEERFGPFKPVMTDILSSIHFGVEMGELCLTSIEQDALKMARGLYDAINSGVVPRSDCCYLCRGRLCDVPALSSVSGNRNVCVFPCGHAYHESCAADAQVALPSDVAGLSVGGESINLHCVECAQERQRRLNGDTTAAAAALAATATGPPRSQGNNGATIAEQESKKVDAVARTEKAPDAAEKKRALLQMQRRLRLTRAKMDHCDEVRGTLRQMTSIFDPAGARKAVPGVRTEVASSGAASASAAPPLVGKTNLLLSPAPVPPAEVRFRQRLGETAGRTSGTRDSTHRVGTLEVPQADAIEKLTDAEILELFGS